jgi:hypothetical protein
MVSISLHTVGVIVNKKKPCQDWIPLLFRKLTENTYPQGNDKLPPYWGPVAATSQEGLILELSPC